MESSCFVHVEFLFFLARDRVGLVETYQRRPPHRPAVGRNMMLATLMLRDGV